MSMWKYYWHVWMSVYVYICHFLFLHVFSWVSVDSYSRMCCYSSCFCPLGELVCELVEQIAGQCLSCQSPCSGEEIRSLCLSLSICVCVWVCICVKATHLTPHRHTGSWRHSLFPRSSQKNSLLHSHRLTGSATIRLEQTDYWPLSYW